MKKAIFCSVVLATALSSSAFAMGGASGPKIDLPIDGKLGPVLVNPFGIAPLTAIIQDGGYTIKNVHVKIVPKKGGQVIEYTVRPQLILQYGGIPVFGMYPDYYNAVEVKYTKVYKGKDEKISETYHIYAPAVYTDPTGQKSQQSAFFNKVDITIPASPKFADRLYYIDNTSQNIGPRTKRFVWNNPSGGALEWNYDPQNFILDTKGEIRWYMLPNDIYNPRQPYHGGVMMGFQQNDDGAYTWGYGQRYVKYDIMGRKIFNRQIPLQYNDFSHSMDAAQNGHYFLRVANADYKRPDGKNVRTVRDVIVEVDHDGNVVDDWKLYNILDPYRSTVLKVLDQGAVCLNIDASKAGKTLTDEELTKLDNSNDFGDITGTGPGRNWAHVNSVDYDPSDDSIIISSRHQDVIAKIGRDKKIKWLLGASKGWKDKFKPFLLKPVDKNGKAIECSVDGECDGGFDFTWTQHAAYRIDEMSKNEKKDGIIYLSAFDNGDTRGMRQPPYASMKYSRAVIYKINQKKMTVEQIWQYGKERGSDWFSPVTSDVKYEADKNSIVVYSATAGLSFDLSHGTSISGVHPYIDEFEWGASKPSIELKIIGSGNGYQAFPFSLKKSFE